MDDLDWTLVRSFLAVAETGSLSAAARRLKASQPTLGRHIQTLEADLQTELFRRQPRGLQLTTAGETLLEPARQMRAAVHSFGLRAAGQQTDLRGTVRITASIVMSLSYMPGLIARIRQETPEIQIELVPSDDTRNLTFREADIALRMYRPTQPDLVTQHLGDVALGLFAAESYLQRAGTPTLETLMEHQFVGYDTDDRIITGFQAAGLPVTQDFFGVRCDDPVIYWQLVCAGCGVGFHQRKLGLVAPGVQEIDLGLDLPTLPVWLTAHEAMRHTPRIRRVWDMMRDGLLQDLT